jgi:hypothetical protein
VTVGIGEKLRNIEAEFFSEFESLKPYLGEFVIFEKLKNVRG